MLTYSSVFLDCTINSLLVTVTIFSVLPLLSGAIAYHIVQ